VLDEALLPCGLFSWQTRVSTLGRHALAELNGVPSSILNDAAALEKVLVFTALDAGATVVESTFNAFSPHGITGIVVIQESHLSIHTWPVLGYAALDVFTCCKNLDPGVLAKSISDALKAESCTVQVLDRGEGARPADSSSQKAGATRRSVWFTDRQDNMALSLRHGGVAFAKTSAYQKVEVVESYGYGKILLLNDQVAFTERDEFVYHEMIAHVPALHHLSPRSVLIVGGGDGGACREFLKHSSIEEITVVEIDPTVTEAAREHFAQTSASLDDARVTVIHGDGSAYVGSTDSNYDVIVIDSLDTAGDSPFDASFYTAARSRLTESGLLVSQIPSPTVSPDGFRGGLSNLGEFPNVSPYLAFLPTHSTGTVTFALASNNTPSEHRATDSIPHLKYVNDGVLDAAFTLPNYITQLLED
jgi:spermidine synthase